MTEEVKKIRDGIIREFCRTIVWIDDEINLDKGLVATNANPLFKNKFDEFTQAGLLCHLLGFPEVRQGADPFVPQKEVESAINTCLALATQSDVFIVDWMLGGTDSSEYAESIIRQLVGNGKGFRFIVVLSQIDPKSSSLGGLGFKAVDETLWKNETGQFLLSLRKDKFKDSNLFEYICAAMHRTYSDCLHLAALEIAGRIKNVVPQWLRNIPFGADLGILVERGNTFNETSWNNELQECIATNLLEDLSSVIRREEFSSLNKESLRPANYQFTDMLAGFDTTDMELKSPIDSLKKCIADDSPASFSKGNYQNLSDKRSDETVRSCVESIETYAGFCDTRSGEDWTGYTICPGAIYEGLTSDTNSIAVCITAGCDCLRGEAFLFLIGTPMPMKEGQGKPVPDYQKLRQIKGAKTVLRINKSTYVFRSVAETVLVKTRSDIERATIKGIVRQDLLNRLVGRYMSHTQRFGVNQPEIVRNLRDEGES